MYLSNKMSLYLYTEKLEDLFKNTNLDYTFINFDPDYVVASYKNFKIHYKDYNEKSLKSFVKKYSNCLVSNYFWNIEYCKNNNVEDKKLEENLPYVDLNMYFAGRLTSHISCLSLMLELYDCKDYVNFIDSLVVDKYLFRSFLHEIDYIFPLTEKLLAFFVFIFDNTNIIEYIFNNNKAKYDIKQTRTILEVIGFDSINRASYYIFSLNLETGIKLLYTNLLLDIYQQPIDSTEVVYISNEKKKEYLGYHLLTLNIGEKLFNLYVDVIKLFYDKKGSVCYKIIDNPNIEEIFRKNEKIIKDILQVKCVSLI